MSTGMSFVRCWRRSTRKMTEMLQRIVLIISTALCVPASSIAVAGEEPDFDKEVAPILEATCLSCHDPHEKKGDLDLSTRTAALDFGDAIVPGDPEASLLLEVVSGTDPEMPKTGDPL